MSARLSTSVVAVIALSVSSCIDFATDGALRERRLERCATLKVTCDDAGYPFDAGACGSSCPGCCDQGLCVDGVFDGACGMAGAACADCRLTSQVCSSMGLGGRCVPSASAGGSGGGNPTGGGEAGGESAGGAAAGGTSGGDPVGGGEAGGESAGGAPGGGVGGGAIAGGFAAGGVAGGGTAGAPGGGSAGGASGLGLPNFTVVRVLDGPGCREVFLDEHSTETGALVRSVSLSSGTNRFALELGVEGQGVLSRSVDGRFLSLIGYACDAGSSYRPQDPKVIARVDDDGGVDTSTLIPGFQERVASAASIDGSRYWVGGGLDRMARDAGLITTPHGATSGATTVFNGFTEARATVLRNDSLYASNSTDILSGARLFMVQDAGMALARARPLIGVNVQRPGNFSFVEGDGGARLYVADQGAAGIRKYTPSAREVTWTEAARFLPGPDGGAQQQCNYVAARRVGDDVVVLCVPQGIGVTNRIVRFIDFGGNGADVDSGVTLVRRPTGSQYLGVAF